VKTVFTLTALLAGFFFAMAPLPAQTIRETTVEYDKNRVPALMVSITPQRKDLQKAFDDWMDDSYDVNMKGGGLFSDKNIRQAEGVTLTPVASEPITFYTKTVSNNNTTEMYIFAARQGGDYIQRTNTTAFAGMERIFDDFLSSYLPEYYEERIAEATEALEDLRKDLKDAREDIRDNEEKIRDLRQENLDLEEEARQLENNIRTAEEELRQRREARNRVNRALRGNG
jgi:predicted ribosome quality control (RQC) complex YloA/Tae2 family protein